MSDSEYNTCSIIYMDNCPYFGVAGWLPSSSARNAKRSNSGDLSPNLASYTMLPELTSLLQAQNVLGDTSSSADNSLIGLRWKVVPGAISRTSFCQAAFCNGRCKRSMPARHIRRSRLWSPRLLCRRLRPWIDRRACSRRLVFRWLRLRLHPRLLLT
jgi:hypothetical protein